MEYLALIFLHVAFGVVWAGGAIAAGFFIIPSVIEAGPAGGAVMAGVAKRKFPLVMMAAALIVVLSGARLYMIRFSTSWLVTPEGIVLTLGAVLAIGALIIGTVVQKPTVEKMGALATKMAQAGGPPSPEDQAQMAALRQRLLKMGRVTAFHVLGATVLMAVHRWAVTW